MLPQLEADSLDYYTILTSLTRIYANPYKIREAKDRLNRLTQGSDSLSTYIAKYERLVGEACVGHYLEDAKIEAFRKGLPKAIQDRFTEYGSEPSNLTDYIAYIQRIANLSSAYPFASSHSPAAVRPPMTTYQQYPSGHFRRPSASANPPAGDPMDINLLEVVEED
jgi:hypothetical protein